MATRTLRRVKHRRVVDVDEDGHDDVADGDYLHKDDSSSASGNSSEDELEDNGKQSNLTKNLSTFTNNTYSVDEWARDYILSEEIGLGSDDEDVKDQVRAVGVVSNAVSHLDILIACLKRALPNHALTGSCWFVAAELNTVDIQREYANIDSLEAVADKFRRVIAEELAIRPDQLHHRESELVFNWEDEYQARMCWYVKVHI
ncbi:hypothetical protein BDZ89DRAFT_1129562 [Hymenopellis radicata]|nr:hypothetical protein BDZ89DRAFT_1129562 [Hymenopellis radicata]